MEIDPIDRAQHLIEAYVVEPLETCAIYLPHAIIRNQEFLLPSHEHVFPVRTVFVVEVRLLRLFGQGPPGRKPCPVLHIFLVAGAPVIMSGLEGVFGSDDFAFEERGQSCMFGSETCFELACAIVMKVNTSLRS